MCPRGMGLVFPSVLCPRKCKAGMRRDKSNKAFACVIGQDLTTPRGKSMSHDFITLDCPSMYHEAE
jgi:hypothetical protein